VDQGDQLSATFSALADPTRRAIVAALALGEATVGELALPFPISGPAISRHLKVLEEAGLIQRKINARWRICSLRSDAIRDAHDWLGLYRRYWEERLDQLAELVEKREPPTKAKSRQPKDAKRGRAK
jgi:DNA-binding transcriptional ArsR family regulator